MAMLPLQEVWVLVVLTLLSNGVLFNNLPASESITVRYATSMDGQISIFLNDLDTADLNYTSTGNFTVNYNNASLDISIAAGDTLSILNNSGDDFAINIDYVEFNAGAAPTPLPTMVPDGLNKFEPAGEQVLFFIGQDNEGVGGNQVDGWQAGYLDSDLAQSMPIGVTTYMSIGPAEGGANAMPPPGDLELGGLTNNIDFGTGPICLQCYLDNSVFANTEFAVHLSIFFAVPNDTASQIAAGVWGRTDC